MQAQYVIEPLDTRKHNRAAFSCGVVPLDTYIKEQASQDRKRNLAVTYVLTELDSNIIIGYYTLSTGSIEPRMLPEDVVKRLPRYDAFPVLRIGRLAIDQRHQGQRLGSYLLLHALEQCHAISRTIG